MAGLVHHRELTDLVEEAVYKEFERISERGGVLGAMETDVPALQDPGGEPLLRGLKHDGSCRRRRQHVPSEGRPPSEHARELIRSTEEEKQAQIAERERLPGAQCRPRGRRPLARLQRRPPAGGNVFEELMEAVKVCSLGQISAALYEVGGEYRRNM